jgi:hypothetical protein
MNKIRTLISKHWRVAVSYAVIIIVPGILFLLQLAKKPAHLSLAEINNLRQAVNWHDIINNPINLPLHILERLAFYIAPHSILMLRLPSVIIGIGIICMLLGVVRHWYGLKAAVLTCILLSTSSLFLADARQATAAILMFGLVLLLASRSMHSSKKIIPFAAAIVALAIALYVPGFIWFIGISLIWQWRYVQRRLKLIKIWQSVCLFSVSLILILPLLWSIIHIPSILYNLFGLPNHINFFSILTNLYHIPMSIFIQSSLLPSQLIPHVPVLNIFEIVMFVLGLYSLWYFRKSERFKVLCGLSAIAIVLIAIGGPVSISLLIPIIYIVITIGIFYMLENWLYIFPINPIARTIGIIVLSCAVAFSCWYHLNTYYVAWQHDPATQAVFNKSISNI